MNFSPKFLPTGLNLGHKIIGSCKIYIWRLFFSFNTAPVKLKDAFLWLVFIIKSVELESLKGNCIIFMQFLVLCQCRQKRGHFLLILQVVCQTSICWKSRQFLSILQVDSRLSNFENIWTFCFDSTGCLLAF